MSEEGEGDNSNPPVHSNRDEVLRKKDFDRVKGLDISSFMVSNDETKTSPATLPLSLIHISQLSLIHISH
ncbi:MAG: hypothetical protein QMC52_02370, partial [Candidatus Poseidoniaceae archaeon]